MESMLKFYCQKVLPLVYDDSLSYYEVQCKLVSKINSMIANDEAMQRELESLGKRVDDVHADVGDTIEVAVANILSMWLNDGTLGEIVSAYIGVNGWVPTGDDIEDFRANSLRSAVSHMVHAVGSRSVVPRAGGLTNIAYPYVAIYDNNKTAEYGTVLPVSKFITTDKLTIGNTEYPVAYMDCSSFLTLVDCCRVYGEEGVNLSAESPYRYAFRNGYDGTNSGVINRCFEGGDRHTMPYTFNYKNNIGTSRMAYLMDMSGNKLKKLCSRNSVTDVPVFNESVLRDCATGDQIFFDSLEEPNIYKRIGHCGIYVKSLSDLDSYSVYYNCDFVSATAVTHPEYGFVIHVVKGKTDGVNEPAYVNVIRLDSLYDLVYNHYAWVGLYVAKPYSNILISTKAEATINGTVRCNNGNAFSDALGGNYNLQSYVRDNGAARFTTVGIYSIRDGSVTDINEIDNGVYWFSSSDYENIANFPSGIGKYHSQLIAIGKRVDGTRGMQLLYRNASNPTEMRLWYRNRMSGTTWSPWMRVGISEE